MIVILIFYGHVLIFYFCVCNVGVMVMFTNQTYIFFEDESGDIGVKLSTTIAQNLTVTIIGCEDGIIIIIMIFHILVTCCHLELFVFL